MVNQQQAAQAAQALTAWKNGVDAAHAQLMAQAPPAAPEQSWGEWFGEGVEDVVNGAASLGYAALQNPGATLAVAGGAALAVGGYAVATAGGVVSMSGVGAVAGVPAVGVGAGMATAGVAGIAAGGKQLLDAASQNPVEPMQVNGWLFGNNNKSTPAEKETQNIREFQGRGSDAADEQMKNIAKPLKDKQIPHVNRAKDEGQRSKGWSLFGN